MASHLEKRKSRLQFVTGDVVRERGKLREIVIEASSPYWCTVRLAGMRKSFQISYAGIYQHAVKLAVEQERAARKAAKKGRK